MMVTPGESRWRHDGVLAAVSALVIVVYALAAQSGSLEWLTPNAADTYYNLLVRGFRAGQLSLKKEAPPGLAQLADPYDPAANSPYRPESNSMVDLSYYKGKLYLYFGVTPALLLFWPYAALTGHYLFHRQAVAIFCAVGFFASVGLLRALWRQYFAEVSVWVAAACVVALGFATGVPVLLTLTDVYEVPISCAYMLTMATLGAIWCALHRPEHRCRWLAAASLAYGLAVGARPSLVFGAVILLVPVVQAWRERRSVWGSLMAATFPIILVGFGLMIYNFLRFENPFEFGWHYALGPVRQVTLPMFSLSYLWFNLRVYFLEPARWSSRFPFVHPIVVPPLPMGRGQVETPFGVLTNFPLIWLALAVALAWRGRPGSAGPNLRGFLAAAGLVCGIDAFVLSLFRGAHFRYEVEFLPVLVLLAVVGILVLERRRRVRQYARQWVCWGWGLLLAFSVAFNLLVGVEHYASAVCCIGSALERAGKPQEAMGRFQQALRIMPDSVEAHFYMGNALLKAGKPQEAVGQYEQALRIKPDYAELHNNLGTTLFGLGRMTEAIVHCELAVRLKPGFAEAHHNLGAALEKVGRVQEAVEHYKESLRLQPDEAQTYYNLGSELEKLERPEEAITYYQIAVRLKPDFAEAHNNLGTVLFGLGKVAEAIEHCEQAVHLKPDSGEAHYNLGIALEKSGRVEEAIGQYQLALRFNSDLIQAKTGLARLSDPNPAGR